MSSGSDGDGAPGKKKVIRRGDSRRVVLTISNLPFHSGAPTRTPGSTFALDDLELGERQAWSLDQVRKHQAQYRELIAREEEEEAQRQASVLAQLREALRKEEETLAARLVPLERSRNALEVLGEVVPARINEEEIGDAMERIHRMAATGKPIWRIYLATAAAIGWILWHTALHEAERVAGIVKVALGKGGDDK